MNALELYNEGGFDTMQRAAKALVASGYFKDAQEIGQAVVKVMAGAELGISPFAAMSGIHIVQGKPTLSSSMIATLVKNDPRYDYRIKSSSDTECTLAWFEGRQVSGTSQFTIEEAQRAELTSKAVWKSYPSDLLFARALTRGARRFAPGIFGGTPLYTEEEISGGIIDVTPEPPPIIANTSTGEIFEGEIVKPETTPPQKAKITMTDKQKYWANLTVEQKEVYQDAKAVIPYIASLGRYQETPLAVNNAWKLFAATIPEGENETAGKLRVVLVKRVAAYAALRDAGMTKDKAKSGALSQVQG